jgi:hypothetical protein
MRSRILLAMVGIFAGAISANADTVPGVLGTWTGTHEDTDPANPAFAEVSPMLFVVQSQLGTAISGDFDWLSGSSDGCPRDPCTTTWSGTISSTGQVSLAGEFGYDYVGSLVGNTISGTFTGSAQTPGYGTWTVSTATAPEIAPGSAASALTLLLGGLLVLTGRRSRMSAAR